MILRDLSALSQIFSCSLIYFASFSFLIFLPSVRTATINIPLHLARGTPIAGSVIEKKQNTLVQPYGNLKGRPGQGYYINVEIGTPPQKLNVLIDTGSSNFAIGAVPNPLIEKYFHVNQSRTFQSKKEHIVVPYTLGSWEGYLGRDNVSLNGLKPVIADIACITHAEHFFINGSEWQGILGLGYAAIARPANTTIPLFDTLVTTRGVSDVFSLQLCGEQVKGTTAGSLILGGVDSHLYHGSIIFTPLRHPWYYEVVITELAVGRVTLDLDCKQFNTDKTIVDSGTTNLRLPQPVFQSLIQELCHQVDLRERVPLDFWTGATFMCWANDEAPWHKFPELRLSLAHSLNSTFTLLITPQQYLRKVIELEQDVKNHTCYKFAVHPSDSGSVIGAVIMEGFYLVFDRQNKRVGFAKSACSPHDPNGLGPDIEGPFPHHNPWSCAYDPPSHLRDETLQLAAYAIAGLSALCAVPLLVLTVQWAIQKWQRRQLQRLTDSTSLVDE